jgi:hypothetical protein
MNSLSSNRKGFATLDLDTMLLLDPKVVKLRVVAGDLFQPLLGGYLALIIESWRCGERLPYEEITWLGINGEHRPLIEVGLLDEEGRIPLRSWGRWYGSAEERRTKAIERAKQWRLNR